MHVFSTWCFYIRLLKKKHGNHLLNNFDSLAELSKLKVELLLSLGDKPFFALGQPLLDRHLGCVTKDASRMRIR